jgi:ABC-type lipoprotein export system ATPase subunit
MFQRLNVEQHLTIILVTHDRDVAEHARRSIFIRDGLIEPGTFLREPAPSAGAVMS